MAVRVLLARPRSRRSAVAGGRAARAGRGRRCRGGRPSGRRPARAAALRSRRSRRRRPAASRTGRPRAAPPSRGRSGCRSLASSRRARRRPQNLEPQPAEREHVPPRGVERARSPQPPLHRRRPSGAAVDHEPRVCARDHLRRGALVVGFRVRQDQRVEPLDPGLVETLQDRAVRRRRCRPAPTCAPRWTSVASPWPTSRNDTTTSSAAGRRRAALDRAGHHEHRAEPDRDGCRRARVGTPWRGRDAQRRSATTAGERQRGPGRDDHDGDRRSRRRSPTAPARCGARPAGRTRAAAPRGR